MCEEAEEKRREEERKRRGAEGTCGLGHGGSTGRGWFRSMVPHETPGSPLSWLSLVSLRLPPSPFVSLDRLMPPILVTLSLNCIAGSPGAILRTSDPACYATSAKYLYRRGDGSDSVDACTAFIQVLLSGC